MGEGGSANYCPYRHIATRLLLVLLGPVPKEGKESQKKEEIRQALLRKEPLTLHHGYGTKGLKGCFRAKVEPHRLKQ